MRRGLKERALWGLGVLVPWLFAWTLLGLRSIRIIRETPNPFLRGAALRGPLLEAAIQWAREALVVYLALGLLFALVAFVWGLVGATKAEQAPPSARSGLWMGLGTLMGFHGLLYLQAPMALHSLHGLRDLPIGLAILLFLGLGWWALSRALRFTHPRWLHARVGGVLLTLALISMVPHDIFRRLRPAQPLPRDTPRLLILGIDGLRRDIAARFQPDWDLPTGICAIPPVPATRKAWLSMLGADPAYALNAMVIPSIRELKDPGNLSLVSEARQRGLKAAWAINDPTTLSFGLVNHPFHQVQEPPGGWTYWFMLGFGTLWPANTWAQNYLSPVETTNTWSDREAFFRDVDRLLEGNHWVSAHDVELHIPIVLQAKELTALEGGWGWILQPASRYRAYQTGEQAQLDRGKRASWRNDGERHYTARVGQTLRELRPWTDRWVRKFPALSGIITADHGETHFPVVDPMGKVVTHLSGVHGFAADPGTLWIPMHPFGRASFASGSPQTVSWFNLRDAMLAWLRSPGRLEVNGDPDGWLISFPTVDDSVVMGKTDASAAFASNSNDRGIKVKDIMRTVLMDSRGFWFLEDSDVENFSKGVRSTALVSGSGMTTYNPKGKGNYLKETFKAYGLVSQSVMRLEEVEKDIARFKGSRPEAVVKVPPPAGH